MTVTAIKTRKGDAFDLYEKLPRSRAYIDAVLSKTDEKSKQQSVAGLRALLLLLEKRGIDTRSLALNRHSSGKPYFENSDLHFGISHSGDVAVCALSDSPVGIDIERIREIPRAEELAARFFSKAENYYVAHSTDKSDAFLEVWTKKEAYLKLQGTGIAVNLTETDTSNLPCRTFGHTFGGERYVIAVGGEEDFEFINGDRIEI